MQSGLARIDGLAGSEESGVGIAVGQAGRAIIRTEKREGITSTIIPGVPHQLGTELVVSHFAPDVSVTLRTEVIELVDATVTGQGQDALVVKQIVKFELTQLYVKPGAAEQIVEPRHYCFEVKRGGIIRRWKHIEREVLFQRAAGVEVETAYIKAGSGNPGDRRIGSGSGVNQDLASAHPVPNRQDAEGDRPVSGILPDRGVAVVHELIAVVFEFLAEVVEHGPGLVAGRAAQAVFSGEGWQSIRRLAASEHYG